MGAARLARERPEVVAVGYFGSYARGDWGVGSEVDLIVVVTNSSLPFERRAVGLHALTAGRPVAADLLVYTEDEWQRLADQPDGRRLGEEVVRVYGAGCRPG